jgi:hypothetical protein
VKIQEAISEAKRKKCTISSQMCRLHWQSAKTLIYWLMSDTDSNDVGKLMELKHILMADDWVLDIKQTTVIDEDEL